MTSSNENFEHIPSFSAKIKFGKRAGLRTRLVVLDVLPQDVASTLMQCCGKVLALLLLSLTVVEFVHDHSRLTEQIIL